MGLTPRYGFRFLDRGQAIRETRAVLEDNALTLEAGLTLVQAYVNQLATILPGGQTVIGFDTDGVPYVDQSASVSNPAAIGIDTDGTAYVIRFLDPEGTL